MYYLKPAVTSIDKAITMIQNQQPGSKIGTTLDGTGMNRYVTAAAYEADE
jgi:hypothetical protein